MRKKGFTLIELLAVIIILAVVALIATPIVLNVVDDARKSTASSEAKIVLQGINNYCETVKLKKEMNGGVLPEGEYVDCEGKENLTPGELSKMLTNIGDDTNIDTTTLTLEDGKVTSLKVTSNGYEVTYGKEEGSDSDNYVWSEPVKVTEEEEEETPAGPGAKACTVTTGTGANLSDVINCGGEEFYVMSNDGTIITMMSKLTLNTTSTTVGEVKQTNQSGSTGLVSFADSAYWWDSTNNTYATGYTALDDGTAYVYDSNSNVYTYVNAYEQYLKSSAIGATSASARLLTLAEAVDLGCPYNDYCSSDRVSWIDDFYIWFGSAVDGNIVILDNPGEDMAVLTTSFYGGFFPELSNFQIRPVVTISVNEI